MKVTLRSRWSSDIYTFRLKSVFGVTESKLPEPIVAPGKYFAKRSHAQCMLQSTCDSSDFLAKSSQESDFFKLLARSSVVHSQLARGVLPSSEDLSCRCQKEREGSSTTHKTYRRRKPNTNEHSSVHISKCQLLKRQLRLLFPLSHEFLRRFSVVLCILNYYTTIGEWVREVLREFLLFNWSKLWYFDTSTRRWWRIWINRLIFNRRWR